jgi:hypothetical protein
VAHVVAAIGDDNLVTTTDYPHGNSKYPEAMDRFLALPLSEQSKKKILWDNALRLYAIIVEDEDRVHRSRQYRGANRGSVAGGGPLTGPARSVARSRAGPAASGVNLGRLGRRLSRAMDVVATCLPGPTEMEQVCLGPSGMALST